MFCNKCGKELSDTATFCSGCGNQVGTVAPAPKTTNSEMPVIVSRLISQVVNLFTKKDPVGVVANSAKDTSFSGLIIAVIGMLFTALGAMVNINQGMLTFYKLVYGDYLNAERKKDVIKHFPSGSSFGMILLAAVVIYFVAVLAIYLASNKIAKKPMSFSGACNVVAYASIPVFAISILNMLFGLIWFVLPVVFMLIALCVTVVVIMSAFNKYVENEKTFITNIAIVAGVSIASLIMLAIAFKTINNAKDSDAILSGLALWFRKFKN